MGRERLGQGEIRGASQSRRRCRAARALSVFAAAFLIWPAVADAAGRAAEHGLRVSASFVGVGMQVDAGGTIGPGSAPGTPARSRWRVVLEQQVPGVRGHSRWVARAGGRLGKHGRLSTFSLVWPGAPAGRRLVVRVIAVAGPLLVARSSAGSVHTGSSIAVRSVLRATTVNARPSDVVSMTGDPAGDQVVVLAPATHAPRIGGALVVPASPSTPDGYLGVVTGSSRLAGGSTRLTTRRATLEEVYSSFDAHIDGTLGQLAASAGTRAHAAGIDLGGLNPSFNCDAPSVKDSITHKIDLSQLHLSAEVDVPSFSNGFRGPGVAFLLTGQPELDFGVTFSGTASCTAKASIDIPIPDAPGLVVSIGPEFKLSAEGSVAVKFAWSPSFSYGFRRFRGLPSNDYQSFRNHGSTDFTGAAQLKLSLALDASISLNHAIGVTGALGPQVTGKLTSDSGTQDTCLTVDANFDASFNAFAHAFFKHYQFDLGHFTFGHTQLYPQLNHGCTNAAPGGGSGPLPGPGPDSGPAPITGPGTRPGPTPGPASPANAISASDGDSCAVVGGGMVDCWGLNDQSQLGNGSTSASRVPVPVSSITNATQISTSTNHSCALLAGGQIDCWGRNDEGELGNGSTTSSSVPVAVTGVTTATQVSTGLFHSCALLAGGQIACWGDNSSAQLGTGGAYVRSSVPVTVSQIAGATQISAGGRNSCALLAGGQIDCWGRNDEGELGNGSITSSAVPGPVSAIADATQVSTGASHSCALLAGGQIKCWGYDSFGQLGDGRPINTGTAASSPVPVAVVGITNATQVSSGEVHSCALLAGGQIDCWGNNVSGELGNGMPINGSTTADSSVPVAVKVITNGMEVTAGFSHSCALLADRHIDCWGNNFAGELGNDTTTSSSVPVTVVGIP